MLLHSRDRDREAFAGREFGHGAITDQKIVIIVPLGRIDVLRPFCNARPIRVLRDVRNNFRNYERCKFPFRFSVAVNFLASAR
jgi:hypothetical protein